MNRDSIRELTRPRMYDDLLNDIDVDEYSTMPMDVDDMDSSMVEMFGDVFPHKKEPRDPNFFNRFEDDFDDSDIN
ncbi:hypothetical protein Bca4012_060257 [Brassica carinata]|uniref:Small acidic protein 1 n=1 Tax=Brassica carinata TaxID=52824 RepID=A0A8X7S944_BRACI|nr:hypothetical protein Bca52824_030566 [Brassica carinata]KAG2301916.1 hypothetical protein Bca52824_030567 [Brassica carinata]